MKIIICHHIVIFRSLFLKTTIDVKCLEIKYALNKVVNKPIDKVTANPFTGPEPNANKIVIKIPVGSLIAANNHFWLHGRKPFVKNKLLSRELLRIRGKFF